MMCKTQGFRLKKQNDYIEFYLASGVMNFKVFQQNPYGNMYHSI